VRTAVFLLAPAWLAAALLGPSAPAVAQPDPPARPYAVGPMPGEPSAALSCASASCHGGGRPGEKGSEFSTWVTDLTRTPPASADPHARAYRVLFNADSVRIAKLLGGPPAHQNALCLKCHAVPGAAAEVASEGVSCAGCHGPDEKWLTVHYLPGWKLMSNREKAAYGFVPTKNLVARASACAACHVGDSTREVDHDLIAAGHPRLNFEYTRFHYSPGYRKHWADPEPTAEFEARAWAVGQLASLRAALDLLHARAVGAQRETNPHPWPEFTEGSCFACHQNVARNPFPEQGGPPLRGIQGERTRASGAIPWQPWYTSVAMTPAVGQVLGVSVPGNLVDDLRAEMEKRSPDSRKVADLAARARAALDARLAAVQDAEDRGALAPVPADQLSAVAASLAGGALTPAGQLKDYDWDFVAQRYLGLAMAYHASGGSAGPAAAWRGPLGDLKAALAFPPAGAARYDSPVNYRPAAAAGPLGAIRTITTSRSGR
jgi:hypothetical protein